MSQGKTVVQAEIDAAAELIDFFRFNAKHAVELEQQQPLDSDGSTNTMLYRGLEVGSLLWSFLNYYTIMQQICLCKLLFGINLSFTHLRDL